MSPDIRTVFPQQNLSADTVLCKIVIRHGFRSDSRPFVPLQSEIQLRFGGAVVDNVSYPWKDHVILNGLRTAVTLVEALDSDLPIVLIGHSMGGLVCRIANLALTRTADVQKEVFRSAWSSTKPKFVEAKQLAKRLRPRTVRGVATLATPNSATLTLGQTASALKPVHCLVRHGFPNKAASFADLTTSGLFRRFRTSNRRRRRCPFPVHPRAGLAPSHRARESRWGSQAAWHSQTTASWKTGPWTYGNPFFPTRSTDSAGLRTPITGRIEIVTRSPTAISTTTRVLASSSSISSLASFDHRQLAGPRQTSSVRGTRITPACWGAFPRRSRTGRSTYQNNQPQLPLRRT